MGTTTPIFISKESRFEFNIKKKVLIVVENELTQRQYNRLQNFLKKEIMIAIFFNFGFEINHKSYLKLKIFKDKIIDFILSLYGRFSSFF